MVKPIGPVCNLSCDYCFYLGKSELFPDTTNFRLSDHVLEQFIKDYIQSQPGPVVAFAWQGGEPTLMGVDFFRRAVELQHKYLPQGWQITNALQTNATLITPEWASFLKAEGFLVGVSIDGSGDLHDLYRKGRQGEGTWERAVEGFKLLQEHQVETNILCVVNAENAAEPRRTYQALKGLGAEYIQFIPLVDWSSKSVSGPSFGRFLISVFNQWVEADLGTVFIQLFEESLSIRAGLPPSMCLFVPQCGRQLIMEHNGDLYSCDHYVEPHYRLGNIMENSLIDLVESAQQQEFGQAKGLLAEECATCPVLNLCRGECPKNRQNGLNELCAGYQRFFVYTEPFFREIIRVLRQGYPATSAQGALTKLLASIRKASRNDLCPCGSDLKFKKCCEGFL